MNCTITGAKALELSNLLAAEAAEFNKEIDSMDRTIKAEIDKRQRKWFPKDEWRILRSIGSANTSWHWSAWDDACVTLGLIEERGYYDKTLNLAERAAAMAKKLQACGTLGEPVVITGDEAIFIAQFV